MSDLLGTQQARGACGPNGACGRFEDSGCYGASGQLSGGNGVDRSGVDTSSVLLERTVPGLHDFLAERVIARHATPGAKACELGAGSGAFSRRLTVAGFDVTACDVTVPDNPPVPFVRADLDTGLLPHAFEPEHFDLVIAIEVIEHLEAPVAFLRTVASLLAPGGTAIITTPHLDSLPARIRFALKGTLRMFDRWGDPTHISPIFRSLLVDRYLPRAGLVPIEIVTFPESGFVAGRSAYRKVLRPLSRLLAKRQLAGDCLVVAVRRDIRSTENSALSAATGAPQR